MLSGLPVIYGINPYSEESVPSCHLGTIGYTSDGRKFRYAKAGSTLTAGYLLQSSAETSSNENLTPSNTSIGATSVTLTPGANAVANYYADGYLIVTTSTGSGIQYRIKSHSALVNGTANTIYLHEPIQTAIVAASSKIDLVANLYSGVVHYPTTASGAPVGVTMIAMTSGYYGWIQTSGAAVVLDDGSAIRVGYAVVASNGLAGAVEEAAGGKEVQARVGTALTGIAASEQGLIMLNLD